MSDAAHNQLSRPWDEYDAYLFDIDGTLLNCGDAVHYFAFCEALSSVAGRPMNLDGVRTQGNTDTGILRDAFTLGGVPDDAWRPRLKEIVAGMCSFVDARTNHFDIRVLPGVFEVLDRLRSRGAKLGVATGNLAGIGRAKLRRCGLLDRFDFAGYSDGHEHRSDVFCAALQEARALAGAGASVCVFGDTPLDVQAAHANGLDVIAIATGIFSYETLLQERPERCVRSLEELLSGARSE